MRQARRRVVRRAYNAAFAKGKRARRMRGARRDVVADDLNQRTGARAPPGRPKARTAPPPGAAQRRQPQAWGYTNMGAYAGEWLQLLIRWVHLITGIAWIGASFYFVWLDNSLRPPQAASDAADAVGGEVWAIHGGGFYH